LINIIVLPYNLYQAGKNDDKVWKKNFSLEDFNMTNHLTESELQDIIRRRSEGVITFAEFLNELSQKGIYEYEIDVATGQATYKAKESSFKTDSQVTLVVANTFNRDKVLKAIATISLPFLAFLKEIADAGIVRYRVQIEEKKVGYIGIGGELLEEQLTI